MQDLLDTLALLDPNALHAEAVRAAQRSASASWELAACLVAAEKSQAHRAFDCASVVEYAERRLGIGVLRALELLRGGRVLARFPRLSQACREGRLCWSKLREIARVVDADTEEAWLEFAVSHTCREIERAVAVSPRQFHVGTAAARRDEQPQVAAVEPAVATAAEEQRTVACQMSLCTTGNALASTAAVPTADTASGPARMSQQAAHQVASTAMPAPAQPVSVPPRVGSAPAPPCLVKLEFYLTADQFAIWDDALDRVRGQKQRRVSREVALEALARHYLAGGGAQTRTNHPVVVRVEAASGSAYYETSRGVLPASPAAVEDALARERGSFVAVADEAEALSSPCEARLAPRAEEKDVAEIPEAPLTAAPQEVEAGLAPTQDTAEEAVCRPQIGAAAEAHPSVHAPPAVLPPGSGRSGSRPRRPHRRAIPLATRRAALARANYRCQRCGATTRLQVDHVRPVCDGGTDRMNLQVLCEDCHALKHAPDFATDPRYARGRAAGLARRRTGRQPDG